MTDADSLTQDLEAGADGAIVRPVTDRELLARVQAALRIKRAEEALRKSEERYRQLRQCIPVPYQSLDEDGRLIDVNQAWLDALCYTRDEVVGRWFGDFLTAQCQKKLEQCLSHVAEVGEVHGVEHEIVRRDGSHLIVAFDGKIEYDEHGAFQQTHCTFHDITDRIMAEAALHKSQAFLNSIIEQSPTPMWISDERGTLIRLNHACCDLLNITEEEVVGKYNVLEDNIVQEQGLLPRVDAVFREGRTARFDIAYDTSRLSHIRLKGRASVVLDTTVFPIRDADGKVTNAVIQHVDITERKRAEEALRVERNQLRTLIDNMPDAVFFKDVEGHFVTANVVTARLMGVATPEQLLGKTDFDFYPLELATHYHVDEGRIIQLDRPLVDYEAPHAGSAGDTLWFLTTKVPLHDQAGRVIGIVGIARDITERKRAEQEREHLQSQLLQSQKMEAIGRLTAGIAHDFNNLLTAINGFAELLQLHIPPNDPLQVHVRRILESGLSAADLVRQLMAFSRKQAMEIKVVDPNAALNAMRNMLQRMIGEDIRLEMHLASDLWRVKVDPAQLQQVVVNLAVNARNAMPGGGALTIETANANLDERFGVTHPGAQHGEHVMLAVADTGCGMSPEVQARIFEPFFTTKEQSRGTGLGLATVYGIVKQSGGNIYVSSQVGVGTTFTIYLPRTREALGPSELDGPVSGAAARGETVLLVEDEAAVREFARGVLELHGYRVIKAPSGEEALRLSAESEDLIHLLLTDVIMPGMSGRTLAEQMIRQRPGLKVLYMSGYAVNVTGQHGLLEGGVMLVEKPFTAADLARGVRQALDAPSPS